jgi:hypothetical protein
MRKLRVHGAPRQSQKSHEKILHRRLSTRQRTPCKRHIHSRASHDQILLRLMRSAPWRSQSQGRKRKKNAHSPQKILGFSANYLFLCTKIHIDASLQHRKVSQDRQQNHSLSHHRHRLPEEPKQTCTNKDKHAFCPFRQPD